MAGFDSAHGDPLGGFDISPLGYAHMTRMLQQFAEGRVVLALEGGYNLDVCYHVHPLFNLALYLKMSLNCFTFFF